MKDKPFIFRKFISFLTFFSFVFIGLTGIVLYFVPPGRIAYWLDWRFLGLPKNCWEQMHVIAALLFIVAATIHLILNWRPLWKAVFSKVGGAVNRKWEMIAGFAVTVLFVLSAILMWPPLYQVFAFGEQAKDSWVPSERHEPPFGNAEALELDNFCARTSIDLAQAIAALESEGIEVDSPKQTLREIGAAHGISPVSLYLIIKGQIEQPGVGRQNRARRGNR